LLLLLLGFLDSLFAGSASSFASEGFRFTAGSFLDIGAPTVFNSPVVQAAISAMPIEGTAAGFEGLLEGAGVAAAAEGGTGTAVVDTTRGGAASVGLGFEAFGFGGCCAFGFTACLHFPVMTMYNRSPALIDANGFDGSCW
jgi:hypothetical protein